MTTPDKYYSYNIGNKECEKNLIFYHQIKIFNNTYGCECNMCLNSGDTIVCIDQIINTLPVEPELKFYMDAGHKIYYKDYYIDLDIITHSKDTSLSKNTIIIFPSQECMENIPTSLYTYEKGYSPFTKCEKCKGYICDGCFNKYCPKCKIPAIDKNMRVFYKYLSEYRLCKYEYLLSYIYDCCREIIGLYIFKYGVLHSGEIFLWEFKHNKKSLCLIGDHSFCKKCDL